MSSALSRRIANRRAEATQKLIVFCIGEAQFALPIQAAERVVALEQLYGAPSGIGLQFALYQDREILVIDAEQHQDREILVIDAEQRIFGTYYKTRSLLPAPRSAPERLDLGNPDPGNPDPGNPDPKNPPTSAVVLLPPAPPAYLLILQTVSETPIGITLSAPPSLRRVPLSAFKPLPPAYLAAGSIRCVSALIAIERTSSIEEDLPQKPPLFLLNLDLLLQPLSR